MTKLHVYDPAMCCSTGVCGPEPDTKLTTFAADLKWLEGQGVEVRRFNLTQEPAAFAENPDVLRIMQETHGNCLPLILVDGRPTCGGLYPSRDELAGLAGLPGYTSPVPKSDEGCCGPSGCC
ncbi:MAG: arsenite efflux transporter metallochaperone ArsD [Candidatus Sumerlaeia bacterium]|nr:arsenite efflux transporter metallochaperone ArsD [Candidatus Sumerlaeia bacterium]